jgi:putative ABC transport system permease protein
MTLTIALQNLFHDRVRLIVTLVGVIFSVVLITIQIGLFIGFAKTTSAVIDHSGADIWIAGKGTRNVDQAAAFSERRLYQALGIDGVSSGKRFITHFAMWQRPGGDRQPVLVVGFDPESGLGGPWNVVAGDPLELKAPDTIFIDELYREQLGVERLGQVVEISGRRARVVGFTRGIRSFTLSPYVFGSLRTAQAFAGLGEDETKFVLLRVAANASAETVRGEIERRVPEVDVYTRAGFSRATQIYWMLTTGAGLALLTAALLGIVVGVVVVAQTLYATTVDHLKEFATLRAIGASSSYIKKIIIDQALISAVLGYAIGIAICIGVVGLAANAGPAIQLPWELAAVVAVLTGLMCIAAGLISIRKVVRLDPAAVFK